MSGGHGFIIGVYERRGSSWCKGPGSRGIGAMWVWGRHSPTRCSWRPPAGRGGGSYRSHSRTPWLLIVRLLLATVGTRLRRERAHAASPATLFLDHCHCNFRVTPARLLLENFIKRLQFRDVTFGLRIIIKLRNAEGEGTDGNISMFCSCVFLSCES